MLLHAARRADRVAERRVDLVLQVGVDALPESRVIANLVAPRANPRETLQVMHSAYDPARRAGDDEPNRKHE